MSEKQQERIEAALDTVRHHQAERQAHAAGEFDEAAVMRRGAAEGRPDLAAIVAKLDKAITQAVVLRTEGVYLEAPDARAIRAALERQAELEGALMGWHRPKAPNGEPCRCLGCEDISRARDAIVARSAAEEGSERG